LQVRDVSRGAGTVDQVTSFDGMPVWGWVLLVCAGLFVLGRIQERRVRTARLEVLAASGGFAGVAGCEEAVEDLREIVSFLAEPERFDRLGAVPPRGALLVGPPGTGKTLLARAVAAEAGVPFISANGSDFVEMYVGVGAKRIRELYQEARSHDRAIVFIDEVDAIARRRSFGSPGDTGSGGLVEHENTLIALLTELDGFEKSNVITIAATNRPDVLDPAVTRPGRLERRVEVPTPDRLGRAAILRVHASSRPLAKDVDLDAVAARTPGLSGADLARVCNEAALTAVRLGRDRLDNECFDEAVEMVALGRARRSALVSDRDRRITAWHEAGHAVMAMLLEDAEDPVAVSVTPRGAAGGVTWMAGSDDLYMTRDEGFSRLAVMLGGRVAEEMLLGGGCTQGASSDLERATDLAEAMVARLGMTSHGIAVLRTNTDASRLAVEELLDEAHGRCSTLLRSNAAFLEAVASELLVSERLDHAGLQRLAKQHGALSVPPVPVGVFERSARPVLGHALSDARPPVSQVAVSAVRPKRSTGFATNRPRRPRAPSASRTRRAFAACVGLWRFRRGARVKN
jgi:cell division protease FtsH